MMMRLLVLCTLFQGSAALQVKDVKQEAVAEWKDKAGKVAKEPGSKPIFYAVIMGQKYVKRHQVSLWLMSLRKLGRWEGEALIITDKPKCLEKTLEETKLLGKKLHTSENVDIFGPPAGQKGNLHVVKRPHTTNINKMKLEKARGWINVKNSEIPYPVSLIVYTDEDIVIGRDVHHFVKTVESLVPAQHTLALFRDTGKSAGELHTGVVVMYPGEASETCMAQWGKKLTGIDIVTQFARSNAPKTAAALTNEGELEKELENDVIEGGHRTVTELEEDTLLDEEVVSMGPDQQALGKTKQCMAEPGHAGINILPPQYFWFPTPGGMNKNRTAEFIHFTNTGRWKLFSSSDIKTYLEKIGIPRELDPMGHSSSEECAVSYDALGQPTAATPEMRRDAAHA